MNGFCECRKCGKPIYWHRSARTGNSYPCDSPTDRRAFHRCGESNAQSMQPNNVEKPITPEPPEPFGPTIEERLSALENLVSRLSSVVNQISGRQPITDQDVPF
jgi:hypothetical protein